MSKRIVEKFVAHTDNGEEYSVTVLEDYLHVGYLKSEQQEANQERQYLLEDGRALKALGPDEFEMPSGEILRRH